MLSNHQEVIPRGHRSGRWVGAAELANQEEQPEEQQVVGEVKQI